ncbi:MAG TPA: zinc-binding dehydrogenase [Clostridiaceae bacterium]|nr:zinc-binding dehydrogenase [Clostridiaceae bacterium]
MAEKMIKVVKYEEYGPPSVLHMSELTIPTPSSSEILIKLATTTVTSGDVRMRSSDFPPLYYIPGRLVLGLFRPKKQILGHEFAGTVVACGNEVKKFQVGDRVYGTTTGLKLGSYAEFIVVPEEKNSCVLAKIPENITFAKAAATPTGGMAALDLLLKGNIEGAKQVMVIGVCGSVVSTNSLTAEKNKYLQQLSKWLKEEKVSPLIDCSFSFDKIPQAHAYVEKGHKSGAVVIIISGE